MKNQEDRIQNPGEDVLGRYKKALEVLEEAARASPTIKTPLLNEVMLKTEGERQKRRDRQGKKPSLLYQLGKAIGLALKRGKPAPHIPSPIILDLLRARDAVQEVLEDKTQDLSGKIVEIVEQDNRLKKQAKSIVRAVNLDDWRANFNPPAQAWWWFFEPPPHKLNQFDWLWSGSSIVCLTAAISLLVNISSRFLSGGPDIPGAFAISIQSVLTLWAAQGSLTQAGNKRIEKLLQKLNIPKYLWKEVQLCFSVLLLLGLFGFYSMLPRFAVDYRKSGLEDYNAHLLANAESKYKRSLALNPNDPETHFYLGTLYEDLQNSQQARSEYEIAARGGYWDAYNNLARLYILGEKYAEAAFLLKQLVFKLEKQDANVELKNVELKFFLYKNLGWARLGQARLNDAEKRLVQAIDFADQYQAKLESREKQAREQVQKARTQLQQAHWLEFVGAKYKLDDAEKELEDAKKEVNKPEQMRGSAHCLLAQVLEKQDDANKKAKAEEQWKKCKKHASSQSPEEDEWIYMARQRVKPPEF